MFKNFIFTHYRFGILLAILLLAFAGLALFEMNRFFRGPELSLAGVSNGDTLTEPLVTVTGTAKNSTRIIMNGKAMPAPVDGIFSYDILLAPGYNLVTIETEDARGKSESKNISIVLREIGDSYVLGPITRY